jgi:hypothetical protein
MFRHNADAAEFNEATPATEARYGFLPRDFDILPAHAGALNRFAPATIFRNYQSFLALRPKSRIQ